MLSASLIQLEYASKHWESTFSYCRWWVWVHPCAEKKKRRKRQNKVYNPLGPNFCKAHISKLVCAPPVFFSFIEKSTSNSTQKCEKKFSHFLDPPPRKIFFPAMPTSKSPKMRGFLRRSPVPRGAALRRCPGGKPSCIFGRLVGPCCP